MDWSAFAGGLVGAVIGILVLLGIVLLWDQYDRNKTASQMQIAKPSVNNILENQLEQQIVQDFERLFPGWKIYEKDASTSIISNDAQRQAGVRYRTEAGEIDILCTDTAENFIVIELKKNKAPDRVVAQIDRYIAWVQENLARPDQSVRGIVIAKSFNNHLSYSLSRRDEIELWVYDWHLTLGPSEIKKIA